ncbi:MAG: DUF1499 domain-containing protein [Pseudanabaenaceae cyanobacterium bins.39]|nr:DUF1499 domain-containing protein [Pseudanabaenaceae cyanobacterium bins.39]
MSKLVAIALKISLSLCCAAMVCWGSMPTAEAGLINPQFSRTLNSAIATPMAIFSFSGTRPTNLGVNDGKLLACPDSPNCVSSQSTDAEHGIAPLKFEGSPEDAIAKLQKIILSMPRTKIITVEGNYLYAEFTSAWMGYVDDVEFYANPETGVVDVRSASRLGKSDLGVNRDRVEVIRTQFS